jgi:nucleotide-binding universal stress UspA family protein
VYDRILFPTDGSIGTAHVALQAIDLAQQYGATIHVLHVVDEDFRTRIGEFTGADDELERRGEQAIERIERMVTAHDVAVETALETGDPATTIVEYAGDIDADVIVLGTHGRSGVERRLIGSVAERVVRRSPCPVLTVGLPDTDVTVETESEAEAIAQDALDDRQIDATVTGVERQRNVWVAEADGSGRSLLVYVDPVTQRASVIDRSD